MTPEERKQLLGMHVNEIVQKEVIEPLSLFMADPERKPQAFQIYHPHQSSKHVDGELKRIFTEMSVEADWKRRKNLSGTYTYGTINKKK